MTARPPYVKRLLYRCHGASVANARAPLQVQDIYTSSSRRHSLDIKLAMPTSPAQAEWTESFAFVVTTCTCSWYRCHHSVEGSSS